MKRATKAPPIIRQASTGAAGGALEEGTRWAMSNHGVVLVGELVHELPREDVQLAYRDRILFDPVEVLEVLPL